MNETELYILRKLENNYSFLRETRIYNARLDSYLLYVTASIFPKTFR